MLDLAKVDLDMIATALSDQESYEHQYLISPETGEITFWTEYGGIDGEHPVDLDDLDPLVSIEPLLSYVWYRDMADFAEGISDEQAGRRLARAIDGKGAFRHFRNELHEEYPTWSACGTPSATTVPSAAPSTSSPAARSST